MTLDPLFRLLHTQGMETHSQSPGPVTLSGRHVRLEPVGPEHLKGLLEAARDDRIWAWLPKTLQSRASMTAFIDEAAAATRAGTEYPFAVVLRDAGRLVGSTRFMNIAPSSRGLEIGWTWYAPDTWGTYVNPEAKYLLMEHAFERWGAIRIQFKTDELNERSRAAIVKLGARFEGILRNHRIRPDGSYRSSAVYSVIDDEWPRVKAGLLERLQQ